MVSRLKKKITEILQLFQSKKVEVSLKIHFKTSKTRQYTIRGRVLSL